MWVTVPDKPTYLEDRGQVLSYFQCLSLYRVNHILHPGAGGAAGPETEWKGQPDRDRESENVPAADDWPRHPRRRDATGRTGRGGGAAGGARESGERAPRAPGSARWAGPSCHQAARESGGADLGGKAGARAPSPSQGLSSPPSFTRTPSGFSFLLSLSRRSSAATWTSRDRGLSRHVTRERPRLGRDRVAFPLPPEA